MSFVDTDIYSWDKGLQIIHGYGAADVDIKGDIQTNAQSITSAGLFLCSNAFGPNITKF